MMSISALRPRILLVAPSDGFAISLVGALRAAGCDALVATDFPRAKALLETRPDAIIADVKLGSYNGIHLAIRASALGMPSIVVGSEDPVLMAEAARQQALYVSPPLDAARVMEWIAKLLHVSSQARRSTRKQVPALGVYANDVEVRLLDVSYDGMKIEAIDTPESRVPPYFVVRVPQFGFACRVQRVWMAPAHSDEGTSATCIGASMAASDADTVRTWRNIVDAMPGLAVTV
jgi:CheY-like chemotaxis protein